MRKHQDVRCISIFEKSVYAKLRVEVHGSSGFTTALRVRLWFLLGVLGAPIRTRLFHRGVVSLLLLY